MQDFIRKVVNDSACPMGETSRETVRRLIARDDWEHELRSYFLRNPKDALEFRAFSRELAFRHVEEEIARLRQAKESGAATAKEIENSTDELQELLDTIEDMCLTAIERIQRKGQ